MNTLNKKYLEASELIGIKLCRDALWMDDRCTWLSAISEPLSYPPKMEHKTLDVDFYSGLSGVAWFLGQLSRFSNEDLFYKTMEAAVRQAIHIKDQQPEHGKFGFFSGWTGLAYVLCTLGEQFNREDWKEESRQIVKQLIDMDISQVGIDVIDGLAGAIPALVSIQEKSGDAALANFIEQAGSYMISIAEKSEDGWSWKTLGEGVEENLTGFAHGVSGFMNALVDLHAFSGEEKYLDALFEAHRYELKHFDEHDQNWRDLRNFDVDQAAEHSDYEQPKCFLAWCHGAPGIGLSRLRAYIHTSDPRFRKDLDIALKTTISKTGVDYKMGYSLCHGGFGNAELALSSYLVLEDDALLNYAQEVGDFVIENYLNQGAPIPNGIGNDFEIPDFMVGLSGMGYFYLRLYNPQDCPSVLVLEPKRKLVV